MTENLGRKTTLTVALLLVALAFIFGPLLLGNKPFRLGLDLQGGTRLVYQFDFEDAFKKGLISEAEYFEREALLQQMKSIIHERLDPQGVREISIRSQGSDSLVIEVPGAAEFSAAVPGAPLAAPIAADATALVLDGTQPQVLKAYSLNGGTVQIGTEKILYASRNGTTLTGLKRGHESTQAAAHEAGALVDLLSSDELQRAIENVGDMQFFIAAGPEDVRALGSDLEVERKRMMEWRAQHPDDPIDDFNNLAPEQGGPPKDLRWYPMMIKSQEAEIPYGQREMIALYLPRPTDPSLSRDSWIFTGEHLSSVGMSVDRDGYPAVSFEMAADRKIAFGDFTQAHLNDGMAIVLNGEIATLAEIQDRLPGSGIINGGRGGFTTKEVQDLITVLRSGSLRMKPQLRDKSRVGASLGEDYIASGTVSALISTLVVVVFMVFVYRRLGLFSVLGLLANLILLMGVMAFWGATLTLPGLAGIVLTVGMAVDGNILIFERLREELARGLKLPQAAKAAFERAAVTILDSNLTTLIAGMILYWAGTGPIRGFATTLCVGILTTLFTVIVVTQVLMFRDIQRGAEPYTMRELVKGKGYDFMGLIRPALIASALLIGSTVGLFVYLPNQEKLGIDFMGGYALTVRTQEPQSIEAMRQKVASIPGEIGRSAEVRVIADSKVGDKYRAFRITSKLDDRAAAGAVDAEAARAADDAAQAAETEVRRALADVLQRGPVELKVGAAADGALPVSGEVYFESGHTEADVRAALTEAGIENAQVSVDKAHRSAFQFTGRTGLSRSPAEIESAIRERFTAHKDSAGATYELLSPIPESAVIGAQVGGELRDKAIRALLLATFATVLYLRFRFAEWSYGLAVVAALVHDVLVTLGALAVARHFDLVQAELDLTMIAAFLTIIGYSQNDTIVIFDRIREILPKSKKPLRDVINQALNETLGRTILTSLTVLLTVVVLFLFNVGSRNVIEGFTFALIAGVISGTYSTMYIAGPTLLWLENRRMRREGGAPASTGVQPKPAT
ncbi:MAG: protein translocase subunit SecD [Planctomycetes bacterium]|nr:protein translocase subunit SecD [Planctomycetota bacterium]